MGHSLACACKEASAQPRRPGREIIRYIRERVPGAFTWRWSFGRLCIQLDALSLASIAVSLVGGLQSSSLAAVGRCARGKPRSFRVAGALAMYTDAPLIRHKSFWGVSRCTYTIGQVGAFALCSESVPSLALNSAQRTDIPRPGSIHLRLAHLVRAAVLRAALPRAAVSGEIRYTSGYRLASFRLFFFFFLTMIRVALCYFEACGLRV